MALFLKSNTLTLTLTHRYDPLTLTCQQGMPFPYLPYTARPSVKIWSEHLRPLNTFLRRTSACPTRPLSPGGIWRSEHRSRLSAKKKEEKNGALRPTPALCTRTPALVSPTPAPALHQLSILHQHTHFGASAHLASCFPCTTSRCLETP